MDPAADDGFRLALKQFQATVRGFKQVLGIVTFGMKAVCDYSRRQLLACTAHG